MTAHGPCVSSYVSGYRKGTPCPYRATFIVSVPHQEPFRVCGYHARGYLPDELYPLNWSLAEVRRWQRMNRAGLNSLANIVPACWPCNHKKGREVMR